MHGLRINIFVLNSLVTALACALPVAQAGFVMEGSVQGNTTQQEYSSMTPPDTHFNPFDVEAKGAFEQSAPESNQERYAKDVLIIDRAYLPVVQRGHGKATSVDLFIENLPFDDGLRMITPHGWQVFRKEGMDEDDVPELVSLVKKGSWIDALSDLAYIYQLFFTVDWYQQTIMMERGRAPVARSSVPGAIRIIPEPSAKVATTTSTPKPASTGYKEPAKSSQTMAISSPAPVPAALTTSTSSVTAKPVTAPNQKTLEANASGSQKSVSSTTKAHNTAPPIKSSTTVSANTPATPASLSSGAAKTAGVAHAAPSSVATPAVAATPAVKAIALPPAPPPKVIIQILPGTLRDNLFRLSKKQGWEEPDWRIDSDFRVTSSYQIEGTTFAEAVAKLLLLHPIEADISVGQKKVFVLREI